MLQHAGKSERAGDVQTGDYQRTIWLGMAVDVPTDWAIVRHAVDTEKGRLVWMDRRRQRMQLSWLACPSRPEMRQVIADYRNMDLEFDEDVQFAKLPKINDWIGLRSSGKRCLTRAARYEAHADRWVELVLEWPDKVDARVERHVCESFDMTEVETGHWRAFGVDMTVANDWELLRVDAMPADVSWLFSRPKQELIVRKLGMLPTWFDGNMRMFVQRQLKDQPVTFSDIVVNGHTAVMAQSREPAARVKRWVGQQRRRHDCVWQCEQQQTLWQVTRIGGNADGEQMQVDVRCCSGAMGG